MAAGQFMELDTRVDLIRNFSQGELSQPWASAEELKATLRTPEGQDRYLLDGLAASAERQGIVPTAGQVYGFKIAPVLGGEIGLSNIEVIDFVVSLNILGQLHRQVHDLPPGTRISRFTVDGKAP